jgi:hypothetical protein
MALPPPCVHALLCDLIPIVWDPKTRMLGSASSLLPKQFFNPGEKKEKKIYIYIFWQGNKILEFGFTIKTSEWANGKYIKDKNAIYSNDSIQLCEAVWCAQCCNKCPFLITEILWKFSPIWNHLRFTDTLTNYSWEIKYIVYPFLGLLGFWRRLIN